MSQTLPRPVGSIFVAVTETDQVDPAGFPIATSGVGAAPVQITLRGDNTAIDLWVQGDVQRTFSISLEQLCTEALGCVVDVIARKGSDEEAR